MSLPVEVLEQSFEQVKPQANDFAFSFYQNLLSVYPQLRPLFAKTNMEEQQQKLMTSLVLVVENLRNPSYLKVILKNLGERHVSYGAVQEHYPMVGAALLKTFEEYLGKDWTPEVKQAWADAYGVLVDLMLEGANYAEQASSSVKVIQPDRKIGEIGTSTSSSPAIPKVESTPGSSQPAHNSVENSTTLSPTSVTAKVSNSLANSQLNNSSLIGATENNQTPTQPTLTTSTLNLKLGLVTAVLVGLCGIGFWYYQSQNQQDGNTKPTNLTGKTV